MKKLFFVVALLLLFFIKLSAQSALEVINENNFNYSLVNQLILDKINAKRVKFRCTILKPDSILYLAAKNQADYQVKEDKLTHFQKKKQWGDPQKRVEYYHGEFTAIAENAAMEFWGKPVMEKNKKVHTYTTYEELAEAFVDGWIHSRVHYTNLSNKIYNTSGIATGIDLKEKKIFAVQVFGRK